MLFYFVSFLYLFVLTDSNTSKGQLYLNIQNIQEEKGIIWVGIYDSEDHFMIKEQAIVLGISPSKTRVQIPDLPFGNYAIALFHDLNHNGDLDFNLIGIPAEPFGFSKRPNSKWRVPKFDEVKFNFDKNGQEITIPLKEWTLF